MSRVDVRWNDSAWFRAWQERYTHRMRRLLIQLEVFCKGLMNISSEGGKNPSRPGQPPHYLTGTLRASIGHNYEWADNILYGYLGVLRGPAERYAVDLELGSKSGALAPRPYLTPTIRGNSSLISRVLTRL